MTNNSEIELIQYSIFHSYPEVIAFSTTRNKGISAGNYSSFNLGYTVNDDARNVTANRAKLCQYLNIEKDCLIDAKQCSSDNIAFVKEEHRMKEDEFFHQSLIGVDALITSCKSLCIGVLTADCCPILLYDCQKKIIAVVHAGWRGTLLRICEKTIMKLVEEFDCNTSDLIAAIGPSISSENYEISGDVIQLFDAEFQNSNDFIYYRLNEKANLDLWKANALQMEACGVKRMNIQVTGLCTFANPQMFYSARFNNNVTGRFMTGIMIR
jgi:polyphenol oxidase